jgi:hypothetical protein
MCPSRTSPLNRVCVVVCAVVAVAAGSSAHATQLQPFEAKRFIVGKLWSYRCYDGTNGVGRAFADGSISGTIQERGAGPRRNESRPAGTITVTANSICGPSFFLFIRPCFIVDQRNAQSFRGWIWPFSSQYCEFRTLQSN